MGKNNNIIEINGKRYDAGTGVTLGHGHNAISHQHVDGIVAPTFAAPEPVKKSASHHTAATPANPHPHHTSMRDVHPAAKQHHGHAPQSAHTLMRQAVHKPSGHAPSHSGNSRLKASGQVNLYAPEHHLAAIDPKLPVAVVDSQRLHHANSIHKSRLISRYNLDAVMVPSALTQRAHTAQHVSPPTPASFARQPAVALTGRPTTTADLLQRAIDNATSHRQPAPKVRRTHHRPGGRIMSISTLAVLSILMFGFVLHQNMPNIRLDMASSKAGFAAGLPANGPAGYRLNNLKASTGQVAVTYLSNSDSGRQYTLTEQPSSWDSATLRETFVVSASSNEYQTVQTAGRTLYIYGQQNITWVNGGIWYQVRSDGALGNQQLIDIATSL